MDKPMDGETRPDILEDSEGKIIFLSDLIKAQLSEGSTCPLCRRGVMEYDGMLVLRCNQCGYQGDVGCFT